MLCEKVGTHTLIWRRTLDDLLWKCERKKGEGKTMIRIMDKSSALVRRIECGMDKAEEQQNEKVFFRCGDNTKL